MSIIKNNNFQKFGLLPLIILFFLNLLVKINFLGTEPFWYDEIISIKSALLDFGHIKHQADWDKNPPFYYYCLWVWLKIVGISEFKARLLSVIFSSFSACLVYSFAKKYSNYTTAIAAALLYTFNNFSYEYTHETRAYSLVVMLVIISSILFFKLVESPGYKYAILLGLVNFLVIYTHYIAGMLLFFQFIIVLFTGKKTSVYFSLSILVSCIFVLIRFTKKQFLLILNYEKGAVAESFWLKPVDSSSVKPALYNFFAENTLGYVLILFFILSLILFLIRIKKNGFMQNMLLSYSFIIGGGSIVLLFLIGLFKPLFLERYLLFTIPFLCIAISWFLCNSFKYSYIIVPLIIVWQIQLLNLNPLKPMDYRLAVKVVKKLRETTNGTSIIQTKDVTGLFTYYYNKKYFLDQKSMLDKLKNNRVLEIENANDLKQLGPLTDNTFILCQTYDKQDDNIQIFDIFKQNNYAFTTSEAVKGVKITLLKKIKDI